LKGATIVTDNQNGRSEVWFDWRMHLIRWFLYSTGHPGKDWSWHYI